MIENYEQNYEKIKSPKRIDVSVKLLKIFYLNLDRQIKIFKEAYCMKNNIDIQNVSDKEIYNAIAEKVQVSYNTISRWHKAELFPSMENMIKLAETLNCTLDELLTEKNIYQEYLLALEENGFSKKTLEIINKEIRATIPKPLFEIKGYVEPSKIDFFTVLNYMIENKNIFVDTLIRDSKEVEKAFRKLTDFEKYHKAIENNANIFNNATSGVLCQELSYYENTYIALINSLPNEIQLVLNNAKSNLNKCYEMYISAYIVYLFNEVYNKYKSK